MNGATVTRRHLLSLTAGAAAVSSLPMGSGRDGALESLWKRYVTVRRQIRAILEDEGNEDECDALWKQIYRINDELAALPANTVRGLMVKFTFILISAQELSFDGEHHVVFGTPCSVEKIFMDGDGGMYWSLLKDWRPAHEQFSGVRWHKFLRAGRSLYTNAPTNVRYRSFHRSYG